MKKKTLASLSLIILFSVTLSSITNQKESVYKETITVANQTKAYEGQLAPNFKLKTLEGKTLKLSNFRGQTVLLNFWASWCPPCKSEIPDLNEFYLEHKMENIVILSVNMTYAEKSVQKVQAFQNMYKIKFPIMLDESSDIAELYGIRTIPTSYLIDENGIIQKRIIGPLQKERIEILLGRMKEQS